MASTIDTGVFSDLRALEGPDEPDFLKNLIQTFFGVFDDNYREMEAGLRSGNAEKLWKAAHTLKSSCANVGALELSKLCKELETIGKTGKLDEAAQKLQELQRHYALARVDLKELVPSLD